MYLVLREGKVADKSKKRLAMEKNAVFQPYNNKRGTPTIMCTSYCFLFLVLPLGQSLGQRDKEQKSASFFRRCTWYSEREKSPIKSKNRLSMKKNAVFQPYDNKRGTPTIMCTSYCFLFLVLPLGQSPNFSTSFAGRVLYAPRVKSGIICGAPPFLIDSSLRQEITIQAAAS